MRKFLLYLVVAAFGFSLAPVHAQSAASADEQWENEILLQLSELRKAQGDMRKQLEELQAELTALKTGGSRGSATLDLKSDSYPVLGSATADVAIVEFSDFQCPYCLRHYQSTFQPLVDKYVNTGKVKYVFVDFPLDFHPQAESAAIAAACAYGQGAFWKMHDLLFQNHATLGPDTYSKLASKLGLDQKAFMSCVRNPDTEAGIRKHASTGVAVGVNGTPSFLIGHVRDGVLVDARSVTGAQPLASFERVLDGLLASKAP